jgi:mRNA-degrading endonuclease RelE of RelBE toxin-antitoxin system
VTGEPAEPFEVRWATPARRALRRLPEKIATSVIEFVFGPLASNPTRVGRPLRFELEGASSTHRGDFRVVYRIDEPARRVEVLTIGHRADVYRRP